MFYKLLLLLLSFNYLIINGLKFQSTNNIINSKRQVRSKSILDNVDFFKNINTLVISSGKFLIPINNIANVSEILNLNFDVVKDSVYTRTQTHIQKVSSIYFDNDLYESYNTQLMKNPDSICIRFKTYNDDNEKIFAECKTRKGYIINNSTNERIQISLDQYNDLLSSKESYSIDSPLILSKINNLIVSRNYKPKLKIIYNRSAYRKNNIRITLDTDLIGYSISESDSDNIFKFQYGILEFKILSGQSYMNIPYTDIPYTDIPHIDNLIKSKIILEIPEFSKFLTVSYYLFENNLNNKPYYYDDIIDSTISKPINNQKTYFPIELKPNTFTSIESLYYKIFNIIIAVPFTLSNYDKLTNHQSLLLNPIILKYYLIISLSINSVKYIKFNNDFIDRTLNYIGTIFPLLLAMITILSIIF
jgi:SPX domain protein involved in polyphosphate accumulation